MAALVQPTDAAAELILIFRMNENYGYEKLSYSAYSWPNQAVQLYSIQPVHLRIETAYLMEVYSPDLCHCDYCFCSDKHCGEQETKLAQHCTASNLSEDTTKNSIKMEMKMKSRLSKLNK